VLLALVLLMAGCAGPPTAEGWGIPLTWQAFEDCGGNYPNGDEVNCSGETHAATVLPSVPSGWVVSNNEMDHSFEDLIFYRPQVDSGPFPGLPGLPSATDDRVGIWFDIVPRTEGDFESPYPARYGGVFHIGNGPVISWETTANHGFVEYPEPVPRGNSIAEFLVYVPVADSLNPVIENATFSPLWDDWVNIVQSELAFRFVLEVQADDQTYYLHEGAEGVGSLGYSIGTEDGIFHIYQILSGTWGVD
jgi:hypothetical protein